MTETEPANDRPSAFPWPPVLLAGSIAVALGMGQIVPLPVPFAQAWIVHSAGMLLLTAGLALMVWALVEFRRHQTSIRPDRGSDALLLAGPFAFSRNPIYLGEVIALIGAGISFDRGWLVLLAPVFKLAVTALAIRREEAYLERRFGADYRDYQARVRRWL